MQHAPAVSYPVGRCAFHGRLLACLSLMLVLTGILWHVEGGRWDVPEWLACLAGLLAAGGALRGWWRAPSGTLGWDGGNWHWRTPGGEISGWVQPRLDWQEGMLLEFSAAGASRWLWLERRRDPAAWSDLRRAVHAVPRTPDRTVGVLQA